MTQKDKTKEELAEEIRILRQRIDECELVESVRRRTAVYIGMGLEVLRLLNESTDLKHAIHSVLGVLKERTGFDAVGIRLKEGDDFPYFTQQGFSNDFLLTENTLVERGIDGAVCRNKDGSVCLQCTCGLVISGKTDPDNALFTSGGSCWTNNSFPLLELPADQDPRLNPRNKCIHQGYASVALIPIINVNKIVGLIQFNDRRKGQFTLEIVELLEGIAAHIGEALIRKQAEDELRKSEARYRDLFGAMTNAFALHEIILDDKGVPCDYRFLAVNAAFEQLTGWRASDVVGKSILEIAPKTERYWIDIYGRVAQTGEAHQFEQFSGVQGKHYKVTAYRPCEGQFACVFSDITVRRRMEDRLQEKTFFLDSLLNAIPIPVFYKDLEGKYLGFNHTFEEFFGKTREQLVGKSVFDIAPKEMAEIYHAKDSELFLNPGQQSYEAQVKDARGVLHDVIYYKSTFGTDGKTSGLVGAMLDITMRKQWEEEKISLQRQLYQSQKLEAVGTMANGIAHNFNNILAAIRGYADMALDDVPKGSRTAGDLENIIKSVESSRQIVSQMLTFSRMDQQGVRKVEVASIVKDAVNMYRASLKGRVDIQEDIASDCGHVLIDGVQLQQVILNLCGNSVHAITGLGGVIEVSVAAVSLDPAFAMRYVNLHEGPYVRIRIKDTGCGMSEETIEHIFEPFFTTKEVGKGTGLGLFMVRKIVVESGGDIVVSSKVGQGTSVEIYLPRVEGEG